MITVERALGLLGEHAGCEAPDAGRVRAVLDWTNSPWTFVHAGARTFLLGDGFAVVYGEGEPVTWRSGRPTPGVR